MDRLKGKIALITGAAKGLGASIAKHFTNEGAVVILCDININQASERAKELGGTAYYIDVSNSKSVKDVFTKVKSDFRQLDILVNNAGINGFENRQDLIDERIKVNNLQIKEFSKSEKISTHFDVTVNMSDDEWHKMISVHLNGTFFCTREALTIMNNQESASIINMGSVLGTTGGPSSPHYSAAKAAILGFTRATARELASRNIRVNAICIGLIKSAQWERKATDGNVQNLYNELSKKVPMEKVGEEIDYANLVAFLASDRSGYITGTAINLDGGMCPVVWSYFILGGLIPASSHE